ncbi:hypothetical protein GIB67_011106 [Kingdonia uniflora]|uniref:Uncharacterized protein n=1 Tax=Kingdonia uniflora TaxID=39325 RepID=A0A7J7PA65_9MAGN|nr:hypothetical protein GIB67_011106 [Kingdonia uniflora]
MSSPSIIVSSPKSSTKGGGERGESVVNSSSPKQGQCLCSPTTHPGSFRCRFHRSLSSTWTLKRSKSMSTNTSTTSIAPKSLKST